MREFAFCISHFSFVCTARQQISHGTLCNSWPGGFDNLFSVQLHLTCTEECISCLISLYLWCPCTLITTPPPAPFYSCLTFKTRQEAVWLSHFNRGSLGQVIWCGQTASLSNRVPLCHRFHYPRPSIYSDSLSESSISLHRCRLSVRDSDYAISADVSNVLPATPLEPDKLISGFAADAFEHKLIAV